MSKLNISGSIGYIYLSDNKNKVLILSDMHSELPYCKENSEFVSNWMQRKYNSKILLEEVPRIGSTLKELWPSSPHTQKLKELYISSKVIDGVDVRPFLLPFSWELLYDNITPDNLKEVILYKYLYLINIFFKLKHKYFTKNIGRVYTKDYLKNSVLGEHFLEIKSKVKDFVKVNELVMNNKIIKLDPNILEKINEIISLIMEWYIIAKIYQGQEENINSFIIHAGLAHTSNIKANLITFYKFKVQDSNGIIDLKDANDNTNGCLKLPSEIDKQFGGRFNSLGIF